MDNLGHHFRDVSGQRVAQRSVDVGGDVHVPLHGRFYRDIPDVTGTLSAVGHTVILDVRNITGVVLGVSTAAVAGASGVFEFSLDSTNGTDGTWYSLQAQRSNALDSFDTGFTTLSATPSYCWNLTAAGYSWIRVRMTAITSGSLTVRYSPTDDLAFPSRPAPTQPVSGTVTANQGSWLAPSTTFINSAASTNGNSIKASAGTLYAITASNTSASARFLKLYNLATAPTVGTSAVALTIPIAASSNVTLNFGSLGLRFGTGIALSITGAAGDADTTAIGAGEVKVIPAFS